MTNSTDLMLYHMMRDFKYMFAYMEQSTKGEDPKLYLRGNLNPQETFTCVVGDKCSISAICYEHDQTHVCIECHDTIERLIIEGIKKGLGFIYVLRCLTIDCIKRSHELLESQIKSYDNLPAGDLLKLMFEGIPLSEFLEPDGRSKEDMQSDLRELIVDFGHLYEMPTDRNPESDEVFCNSCKAGNIQSCYGSAREDIDLCSVCSQALDCAVDFVLEHNESELLRSEYNLFVKRKVCRLTNDDE